MLKKLMLEDEIIDEIVFDFFKLPKKIKRAKAREDYYNWLFYQQSFTPCPNAYDDAGFRAYNVPPTQQVEELIEYQMFNQRIVKYLEYKRDAFNNYLATLPHHIVEKMKQKYLLGHNIKFGLEFINKLVDSCKAIETNSTKLYARREVFNEKY